MATEPLQARLLETEAILDAQPVASYAIDSAYRIVRLSKTALKLSQSQDFVEAIGEPCYKLIHKRSNVCPFCPFQHEWADVAHRNTLEKVIHRHSSSGEQTFRLTFIYTETGRVRFVEILEDITRQKEQQEETLRDENLKSLGTMISGITHELNNPLTGMGLTLQSLEANLSTLNEKDVLKRLQMIKKDLRRAAQITSDILSFSRPSTLVRTRANLNSIIQKAKETVKRLYPVLSRKIEWQIEIDDELNFYFNPEKIERLLINLFRNSIQAYDYSDGVLRIEVRKAIRFVHIIVEDHAGGIPKETIRKIFRPFYTRTADGKGTGLGLTICHGIVREHDGKMRVRTAGRTTRFYISLPYRRTDED